MQTLRLLSLAAAVALASGAPVWGQQPSDGLIRDLKDLEVQKQFIALGVLDLTAGRVSNLDVGKAVQWFRRAYGFARGMAPLDDTERAKLKEAKAKFDEVTGLKQLTNTDPKTNTDIKLLVPVKLVGETPQKLEGRPPGEDLEYRDQTTKVAVGPAIHLLSDFTPIALFRQYVRYAALTYKHLDLTSEEFAAVGEADDIDGGYVSANLVLTSKDKLKGVLMRYPKVPPKAFVEISDFLAPVVAAEPAPPDGSKPEATNRGWQLLMQGVANLALGEFRKANDWHEVDSQPCPLSPLGSKNIRILFGTDRKEKIPAAIQGKRLEAPDPDALFANAPGNQLHLGCVYVEPSEKVDANGARDPAQSKITAYRWLYSTPKAELGDQLLLTHEVAGTAPKRLRFSRRLARNDGKKTDPPATSHEENSALVFIHGYNVSFKDALFTAAQLASEPGSKYGGRVYMYSWPSAAHWWSYISDLDNAEQAEPFFQSFMRLLMRDADIDAIDIIAHSMGSQSTVRALSALRSVFEADRQGTAGLQAIRIGQIIFAAPDVARPVFYEKIHRIAPYAARVTVYASLTDAALLVSKVQRNGASRVGQLDTDNQPLLVDIDNVHVIDATGENRLWGLDKIVGGYGHDYFLRSPSVAKDIQRILAAKGDDETKHPDERSDCFQRKQFKENDPWPYWLLKEPCQDKK